MRSKLHLIIVTFLFTCLASSGQVVRGYTGTQSFFNCGNPDPALPVCNVSAGAEHWVSFLPEENGVLYLNTDGSTFNTVMAAFIRSPANPNVLQQVACDNNSGLDGQDSAMSFPVRGGETNFVIIAGVGSDCGEITFNYSLVTRARLAPLARTPAGQFQGRVTGRAGMRFTIQTSANLATWAPLFTTNSTSATLDFVDHTLPVPNTRFYRAIMLP
jgi:hypothetical protein